MGCVYSLFFIVPLLLKGSGFKHAAICKVSHSLGCKFLPRFLSHTFIQIYIYIYIYIYVKFFELRNNKALLEYIPDDYIVSLWKQCGMREFTLIAYIPSTYRNSWLCGHQRA